MYINRDKCTGCEICLIYCPVNAIYRDEKNIIINQAICCECGACIRNSTFNCPANAICQGELSYSQQIARNFSDPTVCHNNTGVPGRGTEEVKTNDVTGIVRQGEVGISIELGRPCMGAKLGLIEEFYHALNAMGVCYEKNNPLYSLINSLSEKNHNHDYKNQQLISAIIQIKIPLNRLGPVLKMITDMAEDIDTVFSLSLITRLEPGFSIPLEIDQELSALNLMYRPNAKINIGIGKPLIND